MGFGIKVVGSDQSPRLRTTAYQIIRAKVRIESAYQSQNSGSKRHNFVFLLTGSLESLEIGSLVIRDPKTMDEKKIH